MNGSGVSVFARHLSKKLQLNLFKVALHRWPAKKGVYGNFKRYGSISIGIVVGKGIRFKE